MYEYKIKEVLKVVDGDTIDILIDLGFDLTKKERIRLSGIDTPECRTKNLEEKELGLEAKNFLERRISECENLWVATGRDGKSRLCLGI